MASPKTLAEPKPPVPLNIPSGKAVKVSCIDTTSRIKLPTQTILIPYIADHKYYQCPAFSFLIEHESGKKLLFDLGIRKDWENMSPFSVWRVKSRDFTVGVTKNCSDILVENDVSLDSINAIIWSHHHWDHQGCPKLFPPSTDLVVGPGFKGAYTPGWPIEKDSSLREDDWEGRNFWEVDFTKKPFKLGRFEAYDYFGDGSFYLLHTPGHTIGHLCGLARTTSNPDSFVFMGGDACHHGAEFRPSAWLPLPAEMTPHQLKTLSFPCPGSDFLDIHPQKDASKPFYTPAPGFSHDHDTAVWTIEGLEEFDGHDNVLLGIAHDATFLGQLDMFPKTMNDWKEKGDKGKVLWRFLEDFNVKPS
ncbi:hypothetical protein NA57DRAFT_41249 [Rhizodiscina lignyota]|uniref:Metallo-beta-lactamase domain-containing protein n=1 Tax=Rhizodiscina lignyota TaxID=1504668 RepID=A0A9P4IDZ6_9PEZI|nr:hypothetical protein NA57DRAFT_41249 [Rhizodiscina lignyota]